jgi:hypothetical protein
MPDLTCSSAVDVFMQAADKAAMRAALDLGSSNSPTFAGLTLSAGTLTASTPFTFSQTWNNAAVAFSGLVVDCTNTASEASSYPLQVQINGNSIFRVRKDAANSTWEFRAYDVMQINGFQKAFSARADIGVFGFPTTMSLCWGADVGNGNHDLALRRGAAATLQLGENHATTPTAQTIRAHGVTTGIGADLRLQGGNGGSAKGCVVLDGYYRQAFDDTGYPSYQKIIDTLVYHGLMYVESPASFTASAVSSTDIGLTWTDSSKYSGTYRIESSTDNTNWSPLDVVNAGVQSSSQSGLTGGTQYFYRVRLEMTEFIYSDWATSSTMTL